MKTIPTSWLKDRSEISPQKIAVEYKGNKLNYGELYFNSGKITSHLINMENIPKRVALFMSNSLDTIISIHALTMMNIELVIINARLTIEEIRYQLERVKTTFVLSNKEYHDKLNDLNNINILNVETILNQTTSSTSIPSKYVPMPDDILCYVFTSGTTGKPKIVPLSYMNFYFSAITGSFRLGIEDQDKWLLTMPMYHLGGLSIIFRACIYGTQILCHQGFDPDQIVHDIVEKKVTQISLVPTMLKKLLPLFPRKHNLRFVLLGGAKAPVNMVLEAIEKGLPIATTYGMTETCSQIVTATPSDVKDKPTSVGKPLLHSSVKILNTDKEGIGEIAVIGPTVTSGYFEQETLRYNEYLITGDIGYVDEEGDLFVLQRRKDLIISGGENIYPSEIEQILLQIKEIEEAIVIGEEDEIWGQIPVAYLKLTSEITASKIDSYLRTKLASYKLPKHYIVLDHFPITDSGKVIRNKLSESFGKKL